MFYSVCLFKNMQGIYKLLNKAENENTFYFESLMCKARILTAADILQVSRTHLEERSLLLNSSKFTRLILKYIAKI